MPVRLPPLTEHASRILLEGIVDYAGLFPPAALGIPAAVRNFAHYRAGSAGWMLGRFICPANQLDVFSDKADPLLPRDAGAIPWRLSVTASGNVVADLHAIAAFNERHRVCFDECGAKVDAYEVKVTSVQEIMTLHAQLPAALEVYMELPLDGDLDALMEALARTGRRAKIRTGGIVPDAFPAPAQIVRFLRALVTHDVPAKATAGLHHPLRGTYRLTYDTDAPSCRMFGFLNVLLAAAVIANSGTDHDAMLMLDEADASTIMFSETHLAWQRPGGVIMLNRPLLQQVRERILLSVGSCSFTEPVDESRALGWI
ncbi:hypothetical protein [Gemmatimonas phototrophica]|uniref:Uncharacterized protein n=1 Tax=Gemmatimonas phototrophica TaxID=1379270 RepID=A0A143BG97_9BACT|nr:hypothetical protein [Gemmatimonas phototrophica]AMW04069.1 hypothetical protein GEMMAAP_02890 [Gemmatimonas phototrophica]